ncbi:MAG: S8 family peptidase [Pyrinomonadaceae bacterium]
MSKVNVIVEVTYSKKLENNAFAALEAIATDSNVEDVKLDISATQQLSTVNYDKDFPAVILPNLNAVDFPEAELFDLNAAFMVDDAPKNATFLVRGTVEESDIPKLEKEAAQNSSVVNVYADVAMEPQIICPGSPPLGTDADVERLLCTAAMRSRGMDGSSVLVAIVDTGVNMAYLNSKGKNPTFDAARSWSPNPAVTPGSAPVGHGTMCAFDVCIAAPKCTILDIALLTSTATGPTIMSGFLSDAIRAYSHLLAVMSAPRRPGELRSLVVNNSWGMFHPSWDFPVGHPGNYSDNTNHPFNRIVATLERAGADILFAAGNCGKDCPDGRCASPPGTPPVTTRAIYGANSSPFVTCVAGIDTTKNRVGYSAIGPGRLTLQKPDISGYTHFKGSGVYAADGGTSAACPVVSGVFAAVRSRRPHNPADSSTSPAAMRSLITSTAQDLGTTGYDFDYGFGVINGCALADKFPPIVINICQRYPWICRPPFLDICRRFPQLCRGEIPPIIDFCRRYPLLCRGIPIPPIPPIPPHPNLLPEGEFSTELGEFGDLVDSGHLSFGEGEGSDLEIAFLLGSLLGQSGSPTAETKKKDCNCKDK